VNAAGINLRPPMGEMTASVWDQTMALNLEAPFLLGQRFGPGMARRGFGRLIHVSSQQAHRAFADSGAYGVSKGALESLSRSQAEAWSPFGVTSNTLVPGFVPSPLNARLAPDPKQVDALAARTLIGRNGVPTDFVGPAVSWPATPRTTSPARPSMLTAAFLCIEVLANAVDDPPMKEEAAAMTTPTTGGDPHTTPELDRSALIVIDTQVDFCAGGASPISGTTDVLPAIGRLLTAYRSAKLPIIHVVRLYDGDDVDLARRSAIAAGAPIVRPGSTGSQIAPTLLKDHTDPLDPASLLAGHLQQLAEREWAMWKPRWNAFHRTPLDHHLHREGVTTVVVAGCNYPNCPRATLYGASERDYRVLLIDDAISGVQPHHLEEAALLGVGHATTSNTAAALTVALNARSHG
jgi:nicotinamidase-related amidase